MNERALTVSELNAYIKRLLDTDLLLSGLWIKGEISNFKNHTSGHMYMTLKDSGGAVRAVMFRSAAQRLKFMPEDGMKVLVSDAFRCLKARDSIRFTSRQCSRTAWARCMWRLSS